MKIKGPMHSDSASGLFGERIVFSKRASGQQARLQRAQKDVSTSSRTAQRFSYSSAVAYWKSLSPAQKLDFDTRAIPLKISGYNLCIREILLYLTDISRLPWVSHSGLYTVFTGSIFGINTKYFKCVTAGRMSLASNQAYGTWEFDFYRANTSGGISSLAVLSPNTNFEPSTPNNTYDFRVSDSNKISLVYTGVSYLFRTNINPISIDVWYRIKITRTTNGTWTVLIKGGAFTPTVGYGTWTLLSVVGGVGTNPVTHNVITTSQYLILALIENDRIANLKISPLIS